MISRDRLGVFLIGTLAMAYVQSGTYEPSGRDSFYHIKMSVMLPSIGFPGEFPWIRHSILYDNHVSHHYGFHALMIPFVWASAQAAEVAPQSLVEWAANDSEQGLTAGLRRGIRSWAKDPYVLGGKALVSVLFGLVALLCFVILQELDVGFKWFWVLGLLCMPGDFFLRMSYIRAPSASLLCLLAIAICCMQLRPIVLCVVVWCYCHIYGGGYVFAQVIVGAFALGRIVAGESNRGTAKLVAASGIGSVLALISNPYFPENIQFMWVQLFETGLQVAPVNKVRVGNEWRPINLDYWAQSSLFVLAVLANTVLYRFTWNRVRRRNVFALGLLNIGFLILCLSMRRFIEYWPVFCWLSSASFWSGFSRDDAARGLLAEHRWIVRRIYWVHCAAAILAAVGGVHQAKKAARCKFDVAEIEAAMNYLKENTAKGSLVMADDWDMFPMYFYYNDHNTYVCGLDPQFTNSKDPVLWDRYCAITQGKTPGGRKLEVMRYDAEGNGARETIKYRALLSDVRTEFGADYVIVDDDHKRFYRNLRRRDEQFQLVYPEGPQSGKQAPYSIFKVITPE